MTLYSARLRVLSKARSAADDLLHKYERLRREYTEFGDAVKPSDLIPDTFEDDGAASLEDSAPTNWKPRYLHMLESLSIHLEVCCRPLSMLMVLDRDTHPHQFNACVQFLRKRQGYENV